MDEESPQYGSLTALGRRQALRTAKRLAELPIDAIYHSDLPRAAETARIIAKRLPKLPLYSKRCLREATLAMPKSWSKGHRISKAEQARERARIRAMIESFFRPNRKQTDRHELLVTHGNLIRYLVRRVLHDPVQKWPWLGTLQCSLTILLIRLPPAKSCLISFNDVGHLPKSMQTPI